MKVTEEQCNGAFIAKSRGTPEHIRAHSEPLGVAEPFLKGAKAELSPKGMRGQSQSKGRW